MARLRHGRDHILLGHAPRDPFCGEAVAPASHPGGPPHRKSSAVDFSDVFGGPPRRFSLCEPRPVPGEPAEGYALGRTTVGGEAGERSRRWSSSLVEKAEKPVFGGVGSPAHRRHLGDDFFSDIFQGSSESACPSPRKKDRDVFASAPGSRVLSPARPLPPTGDAFGGSFSLPAHLSHSTRLARSYDYSSFRSPTAYAVCKDEEMIPDVFSVPASPNVYAAANGNHFIKTKDNPKGKKAYGGSGHFHFSIYKWASKGVTRIIPSNFKEKTRSASRLSEVSPQVLRQSELPPDLALAGNDNMDLSNEVPEHLPAASDIKTVLRDIPHKSDDTATCIKDSTGFPVEARKNESMDLHHLLDDSDREGNEDMTRQAKKESLVSDRNFTRQAKKRESLINDRSTAMKGADGNAKVKQENRKNTILLHTKNASQGMIDDSATLEDKMRPSRAQGKVKEFVKLFNQETGQKDSGTREVPARRHEVKDEIKGIVEDHVSAHVAKAHEEDIGNHVEPLATPVVAGQNLKKAEQTTSHKSSDGQKIDGSFSEINGSPVKLSDSTVNNIEASFCNIHEAHFENTGERMVKELAQDQNEVTGSDLRQEEISVKTSDTRIQGWSKGKEGNIRSLLSTLQYVLWPGSGWKPVPLVDIIEGTSVRRAYQKALLCLHPDKLQQKGAEVHQKYIAEKVFDILQEAWTHFNSLSSL